MCGRDMLTHRASSYRHAAGDRVSGLHVKSGRENVCGSKIPRRPIKSGRSNNLMRGVLVHIRVYWYQLALLVVIPVAFWLDAHTSSIGQQNILGACAWLLLVGALRFSPRIERRQVYVMVGVATCVEIWSSLVWGIYRYRYGNVPMFVPPGHGLVYLWALRSARSPFLLRYPRQAKWFALIAATCWAVFGLTLEPLAFGRWDITGAMFWPLFVWFMRKPSAPVYAAAFFITSILELIGTSFGTWRWQVLAPVSHIATGNPPSVISAGYCVMDYTSLRVAALLPASGLMVYVWRRIKSRPQAIEDDVESLAG